MCTCNNQQRQADEEGESPFSPLPIFTLPCYTGVTSDRSALRRSAFHLQDLNSLRQNKLAIDAFFRDKCDLADTGVEFVEGGERSRSTVTDVVVGKVAKCHHGLPCGDSRYKLRCVHRIAEQAVRLTGTQCGLPEIAVIVLQLADCCEGGIRGHKHSVCTVLALQLVNKVDHLIRSDAVSCRSHTDLTALGGMEDSCRLEGSIPDQERFFLRVGDRLTESIDQEGFQIIGAV